jgi:ERCC4-type nuclease
MIQCFIDSNERIDLDRIQDFIKTISTDPRFEMPVFGDQDFDLIFFNELGVFNVELKLPADYISSVLGGDGHMYEQCLTMREAGQPCMILILGGDGEVSNAIYNSLKARYKGLALKSNIISYEDRLIDFESNCEALGVSVHRWKARPWKRLLSTVHKRLMTEASLLDYSPRAVDGERQIAALKMAKGIGPKTAKEAWGIYGNFSTICKAPKQHLQRNIGKKKGELLFDFLHGGI